MQTEMEESRWRSSHQQGTKLEFELRRTDSAMNLFHPYDTLHDAPQPSKHPLKKVNWNYSIPLVPKPHLTLNLDKISSTQMKFLY